VVHGDEQEVLLILEMNEPTADQRTMREIEGEVGFEGDKPFLFGLRIRVLAQIVFEQEEGTVLGRSDALRWRSVVKREGGAQSLMAEEDAIQSAAQSREVELAGDLQGRGNMVGLACTIQLGKEPQPLLRKGKGQRAAPLCCRNRRKGVLLASTEVCGKIGENGILKEIGRPQLNLEKLTDAAHHAHGEQGVSAELEEVVEPSDAIDVQQLLP
jgi:hypothetical protein